MIDKYWSKRPKPDIVKPIKGNKRAKTSTGRNSGTPVATTPAGLRGAASQSAAATSTTKNGKRGGRAGKAAGNGTASQAASGSKRKAARQEVVSDDEPGFDDSHVDSIEKYEDVQDWESLVEGIDTIERSHEGTLQVYMTM